MFEDFEFDEERWELRASGAVLEVPPKVMQTIAFLIRNRERVVSGDELLRTLWADVNVTEASLLKAIRMARKVLGDDGDAQRIIKTTRGRGYRFAAEVRETPPRRASAPPPPVTRPSFAPPDEPFIARERELSELEEGVDRALAGHGGVFLVSGDVGVGKTRLVQVLARGASARGARVFWSRAHEEGGAPELWSWIQILRGVLYAEGAPAELFGDVVRLATEAPFPVESSAWPLFQTEAARFRFFDQISDFLRRAAERGPLLLILEDLHAADAATHRLTRFLAREFVDAPVAIIGTYRPADVDGSSGADALGKLLRDARTIALSGFSAPETARLLAELGTAVPRDAAARIHEATFGNPLFVSEIVRRATGTGQLSESLETIHLPERIVEVVRGRLQALPEATRELLSIAAVLGREFELPLLERVTGLPREELAVRLEPAFDRRLLVRGAQSAGACCFAHGLFHGVAYDGLGLSRRAEIHLRAGEALEALSLAGDDVAPALLCHHFLRGALGGGSEKAARYAFQAGNQALHSFAFEEAIRHFDEALSALRFEDSQHGLRADILTSCGHAHRIGGDFARASDCFTKSLALARRQRDPFRLARAALGYAAVHPETGDENRAVIAVLEEAVRALDAEPGSGAEATELLSMVLSRAATCVAFAGRTEEAEGLGSRGLSLARAVDRPSTLGRALHARHWATWRPSTVGDRLAMANEMVELARATKDDSLMTEARVCEITDLLELGQRAAFDRAVAEHARAARASRDSNALYIAEVLQTTTLMLEGRFAEAERRAEAALPAGSRIFEDNARNFYLAALFWIRLEQGRAEELAPLFAASVATDPGGALPRSALLRLQAESGDRTTSRETLEALAVRDFADIDDDWAFLPTFSHLAASCELLSDAERARRVHARLSPYAKNHAVVGPAIVYMGPVTLALGLCALATNELDEAVLRFEEACTDAERLGARPTLARALHHGARTLARRGAPGDHGRARDWTTRSLAVSAALGMSALERHGRDLLRELDQHG